MVLWLCVGLHVLTVRMQRCCPGGLGLVRVGGQVQGRPIKLPRLSSKCGVPLLVLMFKEGSNVNSNVVARRPHYQTCAREQSLCNPRPDRSCAACDGFSEYARSSFQHVSGYQGIRTHPKPS